MWARDSGCVRVLSDKLGYIRRGDIPEMNVNPARKTQLLTSLSKEPNICMCPCEICMKRALPYCSVVENWLLKRGAHNLVYTLNSSGSSSPEGCRDKWGGGLKNKSDVNFFRTDFHVISYFRGLLKESFFLGLWQCGQMAPAIWVPSLAASQNLKSTSDLLNFSNTHLPK